jgi:hypothetical protein
MMRIGTAVLLGSLVLSARIAGAIDVPLDADGLVLRRMPGGRETLDFVARDAALSSPERRSADDPSMPGAPGAILELFGGDGSSVAFSIPGGGAVPGWRARVGKRQPPSFRYLNPQAPQGPSTIKQLVLRDGEGLRIDGRAVGLPLDAPVGRVGVRLTVGELRFCALFDESTVVHDKPNRFAARNALAAALPDCSDDSLRVFPLPTNTTTSTSVPTTSSTSTSSSTSSSSSTSTSSTTSTSSSTTTSTSSTTSTTTLPGMTFGNATEFSGASSHSSGFLLGSAVQIPSAVTVTHLAVIAKAAGANVLLGLYRNAGGVPTTLVVGTAPTALAPGRIEIPVTPTALTAGTYWLMAMYDTDASVGIDTSVANAAAMYSFRDWSQGLPATVSAPSSLFGERYNYYLRALP